MTVTIRRFQPKDIPALTQIVRRNLSEVNSRDYSKERMDWLQAYYSAERLQAISAQAHFYVALVGEAIAGCGAVAESAYGACQIYAVFVAPEYHGQGVGRALITALEQDPVAQAASRIELGASITAHAFYHRLGYNYQTGVRMLDGNQVYSMVKYLKDNQRT